MATIKAKNENGEWVNVAVANAVEGTATDLTNYYTKTETDQKIEDAIAGIDVPEVEVDLTNYYTKGETDAAIQATAPDLTDYAKKSDIPDHSNYALKSDIPDLTDYAKKTDIPDVSGYALKTEIPDTTGFTTMAAVEEKGYQTEAQVLALIAEHGGSGTLPASEEGEF